MSTTSTTTTVRKSTNANKAAALDSIGLVVSAVVRSRKVPCLLSDILTDYRVLEGKPLPFRELGYNSALDLVRDTGKFSFSKAGAEVCVLANPCEKTDHIVSLVRGQKTSKKPTKTVRLTPWPQSNNNNYYHFNNNNPSHNRNIQAQQQKQKELEESIRKGKSQLQQREDAIGKQRKQLQLQQPQKAQPSNKVTAPLQSHQEKPQLPPAKQEIAVKLKPTTKPSHPKITAPASAGAENMANETKMPRPILGQKNKNTNTTAPVLAQTQLPPLPLRQKPSSSPPLPMRQQSLPRTIQSRLIVQQQQNGEVSSNDLSRNGGADLALLMEAKLQAPALRSFQFQLDKPIVSLQEYSVARGYPAPVYTTFRSGTNLLSCNVKINGVVHSTYPNEYSTEPVAQFECALKAIAQIQQQETRRVLPLSSLSDCELLAQIHKEMLDHSASGIVVRNFPEWFECTFQTSLPEHWSSLLETSPMFTIEEGSRAIVVARKQHHDNNVVGSNIIQLPPISLPWSDRHWGLFITHCASTMEVWARLIGDEYSKRLNHLLTQIEAHMQLEAMRPVSIACQGMYLVCQSDSWHRVRVEEVNKVEGKALCFYIDFGDIVWLPVDQLYFCEARFLQLAAQAVPFALFGLEDFGDNPNARQHLDKQLAGQSLMAEVITNQVDFTGKIQVVLYDTSSNQDLELNSLLMEEICDKTTAPELDGTNLQSVRITNVTDQGDVYLQLLNDAGWQYVQKLTQQLIEVKFKREQHQVKREELRNNQLFLIYDDGSNVFMNGGADKSHNDNAWYRGKLAQIPEQQLASFDGDDGDCINVFYVDFGITRRVSISSIFRLEQLSGALSKFPAQVIKVRLYDIPDITPGIVGRIRDLLPTGIEAMVKSKSLNSVYIYRRFDTLCLINEAIRVEHELSVNCATDNSDGSGGNDIGAMAPARLANGSSGGSTPTTPTAASHKPFIDYTRGLTIVATVPDSPLKVGELAKLRAYETQPGDLFEVRVTMSANPSNFTVQPYKDYPKLRTLMKDLQEYCESSDEFIPQDMVERNQAYAAKNPDGFYHRVTVVDKYLKDMIHICYCDFGDIAILSNAELKTLPGRFRQLPKMALQAKLYGITARNGDWTLDDCLRFRELTVGQKFFSKIKAISYDTLSTPATKILELELIDVTTDEDVLVHDQLLKEKRAIAK